jgi:hypothetical protein
MPECYAVSYAGIAALDRVSIPANPMSYTESAVRAPKKREPAIGGTLRAARAVAEARAVR